MPWDSRIPKFQGNLTPKLSMNERDHLIASFCEGLPGVYSTIWCLCYKTNELKKKKQRREALGLTTWAEEKGVAFVADRGRGRRVGWAIAFHPSRYHVT